MSSVHNLPTELLQRILVEASAHDQRTSCAISLVSRRISSAYAPFRFRTVEAFGNHQIAALLAALDAASPSNRRIESLFLCDSARDEAVDDFDIIDVGETYHGELSSDDEEHNEDVYRRNREKATRLDAAIPRILQHAAPSVRAFCLLSFNPQLTGLLCYFDGLSFPALSYLAFRPCRSAELDCNIYASPSLPAIRALVLPERGQRPNHWAVTEDLGRWATTEDLVKHFTDGLNAPLTRLTLTDVHVTPATLAFVKSLLADAPNGNRAEQHASRAEMHGRVQTLEMRPKHDYQWMWEDYRRGPSTAELYSLNGSWSGRLVVAEIAERLKYDDWRADWRRET